MLVLSRRIGEEIVIDGSIVITVLGSGRERVRIGLTAPRSVRIDRKEIQDRREQHAPEELAVATTA
ncbi:MAG: carbon storage regulator [Planctomycetes bacterium]|nr:carbon storage regulator [Planctomycetota bacterium]